MSWKKCRGETEEKSVCMTKTFSKLSFIHLVRSISFQKRKELSDSYFREWAIIKVKMAIYCGTLRQQLLSMHGVEWYCQFFVTLVANFEPKFKTWSRQIMFYTNNFWNFQKIQNFEKKIPKSRIFFQNFQNHKGAANDIKGAASSLLVNSKISIFNWELP